MCSSTFRVGSLRISMSFVYRVEIERNVPSVWNPCIISYGNWVLFIEHAHNDLELIGQWYSIIDVHRIHPLAPSRKEVWNFFPVITIELWLFYKNIFCMKYSSKEFLNKKFLWYKKKWEDWNLASFSVVKFIEKDFLRSKHGENLLGFLGSSLLLSGFHFLWSVDSTNTF